MDYDIDDCSRIQIDVTRAISHGRIATGTMTTIDDGAAARARRVPELPSGGPDRQPVPVGGRPVCARDQRSHRRRNSRTPSTISSTPPTPATTTGRHRRPGNLHLVMVPGDSDDINPPDPTDTASMDIEIRVLDVNDFPTHDGPPTSPPQPQYRARDATTSSRLPTRTTTRTSTAPRRRRRLPRTRCPTATTPTCCSSAGSRCGQPIAPNTGFHFGSSIFQLDDPSLDDLLVDILQPAGAPSTYIDAALAALEAIKPGLSTLEFATSANRRTTRQRSVASRR